MRITGPLIKVLRELAPGDELYGLDLIARTGHKGGTIYPLLDRLVEEGSATMRVEGVDPSTEGRPRRKLVTLTDAGRRAYAEWIDTPPPSRAESAPPADLPVVTLTASEKRHRHVMWRVDWDGRSYEGEPALTAGAAERKARAWLDDQLGPGNYRLVGDVRRTT